MIAYLIAPMALMAALLVKAAQKGPYKALEGLIRPLRAS